MPPNVLKLATIGHPFATPREETGRSFSAFNSIKK